MTFLQIMLCLDRKKSVAAPAVLDCGGLSMFLSLPVWKKEVSSTSPTSNWESRVALALPQVLFTHFWKRRITARCRQLLSMASPSGNSLQVQCRVKCLLNRADHQEGLVASLRRC